MNVLLVPSSYAPNIGGVEEMTRGLARELRARGQQVRILTGRWPASLPGQDEVDGVSVRRLHFEMPARHPMSLFRFACRFGPALRQTIHEARSFKADLIHVHCLGPNTLYAALAAAILRKPLVLTTHGEFQGDDTNLRRSFFMSRVHRWALRRAAWVTACSQFTLDHIPYPFHTRSSVVYNAGPPVSADTPLPVGTDPPFVFCAARLTYNKGLDIALNAFALACDQNPGLQFWIAGDGKERCALEKSVDDLKITHSVKFLGNQTSDEVRQLMTRCLFYVCPSRNEGFGLASLEAMAAGKAVLATRVGGVPEIVQDGVTGLLVPGGDAPALAQAMTRLAADAPRRQTLGEAGRERAQQFDWDAIADQYLSIYSTVRPSR